MQTTIETPRDPASQRIEDNLQAHHASEVRVLDGADERRKAQRASLLRSDGQPKYTPAEHAERLSAIDAEFEAAARRVTEAAEAAVVATRQELTVLEGSTPFDTLTVAEQETAVRRRELVKEDCDQRRPDQLVAAARAALARGDKALIYLLDRYLPARLERDGQRRDLALSTVARELSERLADPRLKEKREAAERKLSAAQVLGGRVDMVRRGGIEGLMNEMRARGFPRL